MAIERLTTSGRLSEAALIQAAFLVVHNRADEAAAALEQALTTAPAGPFGWSIPVEPLFAPVVNSAAFTRVRVILSERAS